MTRATTSHIRCRCCGGRCYIPSGGNQRFEPKHEAMGEIRRYRVCESCGVKVATTEVDTGDLCELRRKAHLYVMHCQQRQPKGAT